MARTTEPLAVRRAANRLADDPNHRDGVWLRALAIVLIVGTHADLFSLQGTAHALLVLVGFNLARFTLGGADRATRVRALLTALRRVAAPALVVIGAVHLATGQYALSTVGLLNWLLGEPRLGPDWRFWFVESAVVVILAVTAVVATPWGDRLERRHPFALPLALSVAAMLWWQEVLFPPVPHMQGSPLVVAWLFFLGWAAARAGGLRERLVVTVVAIPSVGTFSGNPRRDLLTLAAVLLVLWVPTLRVPSPAVPTVRVLAASSLFVYVVHWQVLEQLWGSPVPAFSRRRSLWAWRTGGSGARARRRRCAPSAEPGARASRGPAAIRAASAAVGGAGLADRGGQVVAHGALGQEHARRDRGHRRAVAGAPSTSVSRAVSGARPATRLRGQRRVDDPQAGVHPAYGVGELARPGCP